MNIWGKVIGFFFGYLILEPLGAVIGVLVGALFDRGLAMHLHHIPRSYKENVQRAFFTATFSVMGHLAKADGRVSEHEIRVAEKIMDRLELNEDYRKEAIRLFNLGKDQSYNLSNQLDILWQECQRFPDLLRFFLEIQLEAALADGQLHPNEKRILIFIAERLHVSSAEFEQLMARQWASQAFYHWFDESNSQNQNYDTHSGRSWEHSSDEYGSYGNGNHQSRDYSGHNSNFGGFGGFRSRHRSQSGANNRSSLSDAYGVLGIQPESSQDEIKKAYRRLMNQHHPDKLASKGLPEGMLKLAIEKTQQITAAYEMVREARGFR